MKAIYARYLGPTDTCGSRIKATAEGGHSVTIPYPHELSGQAVYRAAAEKLALKMGWTHGVLLGGDLPDGGYAFVFDCPAARD